MKTIILTVCILFFFGMSNPTQAQTKNEAADLCKGVAASAYLAMQLRQGGVPFTNVYNLTDNEIMNMLLREAYSRPKFGTKPYQDRAVIDFSDESYIKCLDATDKF